MKIIKSMELIESNLETIQSMMEIVESNDTSNTKKEMVQLIDCIRKQTRQLKANLVKQNNSLLRELKMVLDGYGTGVYDWARIIYSYSTLQSYGKDAVIMASFLDEYFGNIGITKTEWSDMNFEVQQ